MDDAQSPVDMRGYYLLIYSTKVKTSFAPESGRERTFSFENLHRTRFNSSKEAWKTSGKPAEKGCFFPYEIVIFFQFFFLLFRD